LAAAPGSTSKDDKLCFIQFLHPGEEHQPDAGGFKQWNRKGHRRKFLKNRGRYLVKNDLHDVEIVFWGEWEPATRVIEEIDKPLADGPHWVYEPYYVPPSPGIVFVLRTGCPW
jgi:hypothetical protein